MGGHEGARLFVWGTWALMLAGALVYIRVFSTNMPFYDEFTMVGLVTGDQPLTLSYLWSLHNEHRIPLPRLLYLGLARLTYCDFRAGMYANALLLAFPAAGMILAARRLRGGTTYADAFFPLALLHIGHVDSLLASFQVAFTAAAALTCCLLWLILRSRQSLTARTALAGGACLLLLPLCGAHGLPFVPPLAAWFVFWAWRDRGTPGGVRRLLVALLLTAASLFLVVFYFRGFEKMVHHAANPGWRKTLQVAAEFLTNGAGIGAAQLWPHAGYVLAALLVVGSVVLARRFWQQPRERVCCLGLGMFLVGMAGLAAEIGYGRAPLHIGRMGFALRYTTLAAPGFCGLYFLGEIASVAWVARCLQMGLLTCLAAMLLANCQTGVYHGKLRRALLAPIVKELEAAPTAEQLAQKHPSLCWDRDYLVARLEMLRRAGIGKFKHMSAAPAALREIGVPATPALTTDMTWKGVIGQITGNNPCLSFVLPQPERVYAIRLTYTFANKPEPTADFVLLWKHEGQNDYSDALRSVHLWLDATPGPHQVVVYVNNALSHFIVRPDVRPCTFRLSGIQLLVPDDPVNPPTEPEKMRAAAPVAKGEVAAR
jgi:hypothetical protein